MCVEACYEKITIFFDIIRLYAFSLMCEVWLMFCSLLWAGIWEENYSKMALRPWPSKKFWAGGYLLYYGNSVLCQLFMLLFRKNVINGVNITLINSTCLNNLCTNDLTGQDVQLSFFMDNLSMHRGKQYPDSLSDLYATFILLLFTRSWLQIFYPK